MMAPAAHVAPMLPTPIHTKINTCSFSLQVSLFDLLILFRDVKENKTVTEVEDEPTSKYTGNSE